MKTFKSSFVAFLRGAALVWFMTSTPGTAAAATIWNGSNIGIFHSDTNGVQDFLTSGFVITRGSSGGLYNSAVEAGATPGISPKNTGWAIGSLANFNTLTYGPCPLEAGHNPPSLVGTNFVVHLTNTEDIYFSLTLTNWGGAGGFGDKTFGYIRSTAAQVTPAVTITNPANGAVFAAPANVNIGATATVSSGTVTNVQFFTNGVALGSRQTAPFTLTASNLAAGSYALKAAATAGGISATSSVVNVTVVTPVAVSLIAVKVTNGQFSFNYTANSGLTYVVERSSNLVSWVSLATNVAAGNPVSFSDPFTRTGARFYRVVRPPNP
jgi:hypothetical protein